MLTTAKNREVDAAVFSAVAKELLAGTQLLESLAVAVEAVPTSGRPEATRALIHLRDALADHVRQLADDQAVSFARDHADPLVSFGTDLVENSIFWARVSGQAGERHVVKIAFEDPMLVPATLQRRVFAALSWQAIAVEYPIPHIGNAGIYHCQMIRQLTSRCAQRRSFW